MSLKVINIVNHPPAYEAYRARPRPEINWDLSNGSWVGIWGYDWHNIIGNKVLEVSDDIEYEVWQPDLRADKIYEHRFENGLLHKLFPAETVKFRHGLKFREEVSSKLLLTELENEIRDLKNIVLHINAGYRLINIPILKRFHDKVPIVGQFYTSNVGIFNLPRTVHPFKLLNAYLKLIELKNYYNKIKYIIPGVSEGLKIFESKFGIEIFYRNFANFGSNFNDWKRTKTKGEARKALNISNDTFVMFSSSRLIPIKQIDILILSLKKITKNFICFISGHGSEEYEKYLTDLVKKNNLEEKVKFIGYVDLDVLKLYFQAADLFVSTSKQDVGPAPPFQATAFGLPSLITNTGLAAEFFKLHNVGLIVPIDNYEIWVEAINKIIDNNKLKIADRKMLEAYGDWHTIARYYYNIYKTLNHKI